VRDPPLATVGGIPGTAGHSRRDGGGIQRGGRPGLSGMRAVDAVIIASARMRDDVLAAARRRDPCRSSQPPCTMHHAPCTY
jgi:hypothetical protein